MSKSQRFSDQWSFTVPFEGIVPHMYLDTGGWVTVGVGFLIASENECAKLPWKPNTQAALADFQVMRSQDVRAGSRADAYAQYCSAHLELDDISAIFESKVLDLRALLQRQGYALERHPQAAQIAIVDMAYNLGVGGLNRFTLLRNALRIQDYMECADQCSRRGIQPARNIATRELFLSAMES